MIRAIIAIGITLALAGLWWHGYKKGERADRARSDLVIADMKIKAADALADANEKVRLASKALQATAERAGRELLEEKARHDRRLADFRATNDLVRDTIAEFARGAGEANDTAAAASRRAEALGVLLGESVRVQEDLAGAAESEAATGRALLSAWPKPTEKP